MKKIIIFITLLIIFVSFFLITSNYLSNEKTKNNTNDETTNVEETKKTEIKKEEEKVDNENTETEKNIPKTEEKQNKIQNSTKNKDVSSIELIGDEEIILNINDNYVEYGAKAYNKKGEDISEYILIDSGVDTSKVGTYNVSYSIGNYIVIRTIIVK